MTDTESLEALVEARRTVPPPHVRKRIRERCGVSLAALADAVGVTPRVMSALERVDHPAEEHLVAYARALKVMETPEPDEVEDLKALFESHPCKACGGLHTETIGTPGACPRIRRVAYDSHGNITEMDFWPEGAWSREGILFPRHLGTDSAQE